MSIKILMLVPNMQVANGVASYAMNYFRSLKNEKAQIDFALYRDLDSPYYEEITSSGSKLFILPDLKSPIKHIKACNRILREGGYDIVHDNTLLVSVPMMWVAKIRRIPVRILHSHSSRLGETPHNEKRNKVFLPLLKITATDRAACSDVAAKSMFGKKSYNLIPNIVFENTLVYSDEKRKKIRRQMEVGDKIVIGTVGRISPPKNPLFALKVIKAVVRKRQDVIYWWIGSGTLDEELKAEVTRMGLERYVKFFGSRDDVPDLYQAMDLFFLPSLFEGMPITGIEAQVMGLPSVVSDTITKELLFTDLVHYVSLDEPPEKWADVMIDIMNREDIRRSCIRELKNSVFSEKMAGSRLAHLYKSLLVAKGIIRE